VATERTRQQAKRIEIIADNEKSRPTKGLRRAGGNKKGRRHAATIDESAPTAHTRSPATELEIVEAKLSDHRAGQTAVPGKSESILQKE
jgi:hypothetical protein